MSVALTKTIVSALAKMEPTTAVAVATAMVIFDREGQNQDLISQRQLEVIGARERQHGLNLGVQNVESNEPPTRTPDGMGPTTPGKGRGR